MLNTLIDRLQAAFPPNRIVVLLTPLFSAAAGWLAVKAAELGLPPVDETWLVGAFAVGAASAAAAVHKWLDGWQKYENRP